MAVGLRHRARVRLRRLKLSAVDRFGAFTEPVGLLIIGVPLVLLTARFGVGGAADVAAWVVTLVIAAAAIFAQRQAGRHSQILTELTAGYILSGDRQLLDTFIGKLIGGAWSRASLEPGSVLFDTLGRIAQEDDYEQKRRVAEALPALARMNPDRTLGLMRELRDDWDDKWKSDLRRRVVEALVVPVAQKEPTILDLTRPREVAALLRLRDGDEIYTAMAVAEVLAEWLPRTSKIAVAARAEYAETVASTYGEDERRGLDALTSILAKIRESPAEAARLTREILECGSLFERIGAVRAAVRYVDRLPSRDSLELLSVASQDEHRYVRRAVAREMSMKFLLRQSRRGRNAPMAVEIVNRLILDEDDIISLTAFDILETWTSPRGVVLRDACQLIQQRRSGPPALLERVERALSVVEQPR